MGDVSGHSNTHIHPAIRDRVLKVSSDPRLRLLALSGESCAALDSTVALFEMLTPTNFPNIDRVHYDAAEAAANLLRLVRQRVALWESGQLPTPAVAATTKNYIARCENYLTDWLAMLGSCNPG